MSLAPDKETERQFLPTPSELKGRLLLADRGYPSIDYFKALDDAGASFVMRLSRGFDPEVRAFYSKNGKRYPVRNGTRLATFLAQKPGQSLDLDVVYVRRGSLVAGRIVIVHNGQQGVTRLACNLPRDRFTKAQVAQLYRFRWAGGTMLQGIEIVRESEALRHRQQAHCRRHGLGKPVCLGPQEVPRSRNPTRVRQADLNEARRHVS